VLDHEGAQLGLFDLGGVLYHAHYFDLYEQARESFLRAGELPYSDLVANEQHLTVVESHQEFLAPVRYGECLRIRLWVSALRRSSFVFHYAIDSSADRVSFNTVHHASTRMAFVEASVGKFRIRPLPEKLLDWLRLHC